MANDLIEQEINLQDYLFVLDKRKWTILLLAFLSGVIALLISLRMVPIYRSQATLLIEKETPQVTSIEEVAKIETRDIEYYNTQLEILKSRSLALRVFKKLKLQNDPMFISSRNPISAFLSNLKIKSMSASRLVEVGFEGPDRQEITQIVNTLTETYIEQIIEMKAGTSKYALSWLTEQFGIQKKKLEKSELALQKYLEENKISDLPKIEEQTNLLEILRAQQARLKTEQAQLSQRYKEKHPRMLRLTAELAAVEEKIQEETERVLRLSEIAFRYNMLNREVESNRELYNTLLKRAKETTISENLTLTNIKIIDPAEVPEKPIKPKKRANVLIGTVIGLFSGVFLSFFLEFLEDTVKTSDDIEHYLQVPFLGSIPSTKREAKTIQDADLTVYRRPKSMVSEVYRALRTEIFRNSGNNHLKTILITSATPQEGKTTVAVNLAIALAQNGEKVLLLEADTRRPRLKKTFNFNDIFGLCDYLIGQGETNSLIQETEIPNLKVIASGHIPEYPAELVGSAKMKHFFQILEQKFDRIIVDTPPILSVADPLILADCVDATIQVVHSDAVKKGTCAFAAEKLSNAKAKFLGVILNNIEPKREGYYYYHHYGHRKEKKKSPPDIV